jgi:hypothetical protein
VCHEEKSSNNCTERIQNLLAATADDDDERCCS